MGQATLPTALLAALLLLLGCAPAATNAEKSCPDGFNYVTEYRLFFGLDDSAGNRVSEADWQAFLEDTITPRFPAGLTVIDVKGQWREPGGDIQRENTILVIALQGSPIGDGLRLINEISEEFVRRFNQDPVFRVIDKVCSGLSG